MPSSSWPAPWGGSGFLTRISLKEDGDSPTPWHRSRGEGSVRAAALTAVGGIAGWQGDADRGPAWLSEGIALWRELGDVAELAYALETLGWVLFVVGDNLPSLAAFEESLELRRTSGDALGEMRSLGGVCQMLVAEGEVDRAEPLSRQLLELAARRG